MKSKRLDEQRIDYDGRLNRQVRRTQESMALAQQVTELSRETDKPMDSRATAAGDVEKLRGIPCQGRGIGGGIRGTRPDTAWMPETVVYALAIVASDVDGTSPGTQPEEALMAKEDAA